MKPPICTTPRVADAIEELHEALKAAYGVDFAFKVTGMGHIVGSQAMDLVTTPTTFVVNADRAVDKTLIRYVPRIVDGRSVGVYQSTDDGQNWVDHPRQDWCTRQQWVAFSRYDRAIQYIHSEE